MHPGAFSCVQFQESLHRFLRVHVDFAPTRRIIGADWEQRDFDVVALADFLEAGEISAVAAVKNRAPTCVDHKPTESTMEIRQKPRAPVMAGCERNLQAVERHALPV